MAVRVLVLVLVVLVVAGAEELTAASFTSFLATHPLALVDFYAPWCGHCKKLAPHFTQAAEILAADGIALGTVDCIAQESLYWSNNIKGYPTLLAFLGGEPLPYDGPREAASIVSFMRILHAPVLVPLHSSRDITRLSRRHLSATKPLALVFVDAKQDAESVHAERTLDFVCKMLDAFTCGVVRSDATLAAQYGVTSLPGFAVMPTVTLNDESENQESMPVVLQVSDGKGEHPTVGELRTWVLENAYPAVVPFAEQYMDLMFSPKRPGFEVHVLLFLDSSATGVDTILEAFREQAHRFMGRCVFIAVDVSTEGMTEFTENLLSDLGVQAGQSPKMMIIKSARTKIAFYDPVAGAQEGFTSESIQRFVHNYFEGDITPSRLIEVPP